jgi:hypothetical protein
MSSRSLPVAVAALVLVVASQVYAQTEASVSGVVIDDTKSICMTKEVVFPGGLGARQQVGF